MGPGGMVVGGSKKGKGKWKWPGSGSGWGDSYSVVNNHNAGPVGTWGWPGGVSISAGGPSTSGKKKGWVRKKK